MVSVPSQRTSFTAEISLVSGVIYLLEREKYHWLVEYYLLEREKYHWLVEYYLLEREKYHWLAE